MRPLEERKGGGGGGGGGRFSGGGGGQTKGEGEEGGEGVARPAAGSLSLEPTRWRRVGALCGGWWRAQ